MTVSVLVADDERLIRVGLRATLETTPDIRVVAEAENGAEAVDRAQELRPDVVLMDMRMPVMDGIAATAAIADDGLGRVLVLTTFESDDLVLDALGAGASGYLLKRCRPEELIDAIRVVAAGEAVLASSVAAAVVRRLRRVPRFAQAASLRIGELTPARARDPAAGRPEPLERRDRRPLLAVRRHGQDARQARVREARAARPRPGCRLRVRDRAGRARRAA